MTILPIVERELRVASRRPFTMRVTVATVAIVVGVFVFLLNLGASQSTLGTYIFTGLAIFSMLHCLFAGRAYTSDCLSEEKREGTLGLLFLTDLKGYDVVLGKLVATSVNGFYSLLGVFPVLALPLLMGGISSGQFWRVVLALMDAFLFSLAIGMFSSAICRESRRAMGLNFALLALFVLLLPGLGALLAAHSASQKFHTQFLYACPPYGLFIELTTPFIPAGTGPPRHDFWKSLTMIHTLTWVLLILAAVIVPRSWKDKPAPAKRTFRARLGDWWHRWNYGDPRKRPAFRKRLLDVNAFYWLAARAKLKPLHVWTAYVLLVIWWIWGRIEVGTDWLDEGVAFTAAIMINVLLKLWITMEATQRLAEAHKAGALELMLSTPLSVRDIIKGQYLALRRQFLWPFLAGLAVQVGLMFYSHYHRQGLTPQTDAFWIAMLVFLPIDIIALFWVSMARSLTSKNMNQAVINTVFCVLILPWLAFGVISALTQVWCFLTSFGTPNQPDWPYYLCWWCGLSLAAAILFAHWARRLLLGRMREIAMQRYAPPQRKRFIIFPRLERKTALQSIGTVTAPAVIAEKAASKKSTARPVASGRSVIKKRFRYALALLAIVVGVAFFYPRSAPPKFPPPVTISLSLSKGEPQIYCVGNGAYFVLADGTLWRWGFGGVGPPASVPERFDTNGDWKAIAPANAGFDAIRTDGTLWEVHYIRGATQIDAGTNWLAVVGGGAVSYAIKNDGSLWSWGMPLPSRSRTTSAKTNSSSSTPTNQPNLVQVGTETNWVAVRPRGQGMVGLKRDGSLWAWGQIWIFAKGQTAPTTSTSLTLSEPVQICRETNWVAFEQGWNTRVRNRDGELWALFFGKPNPELPAAANSELVISNAVPGKFGLGYYDGQMLHCEIRSDGTLWERTFDDPTWAKTGQNNGPWQQVGNRRDWLKLESGNGMIYGLTADGTLWTWGIDPTMKTEPSFSRKIRLMIGRLKELSAMSRTRGGSGSSSQIPLSTKEPHPLLQLKGDEAAN